MLVAVILIVLVVNSASSSCGSSKILTWTGKYNSGAIARARVGKYNLGTGTVNELFLVRAGKSKLGSGPGAKQRAGGREKHTHQKKYFYSFFYIRCILRQDVRNELKYI